MGYQTPPSMLTHHYGQIIFIKVWRNYERKGEKDKGWRNWDKKVVRCAFFCDSVILLLKLRRQWPPAATRQWLNTWHPILTDIINTEWDPHNQENHPHLTELDGMKYPWRVQPSQNFQPPNTFPQSSNSPLLIPFRQLNGVSPWQQASGAGEPLHVVLILANSWLVQGSPCSGIR